ncbi:MAG TPA: response regulator [Hellea balneolensis]|uniref:Response regulator n=1 Tax=Hellea balneolensis TaxID=287478 RepID=A0A7C5LVQ0_9PROT|nr:response regulator [Hellea balneolensis]
MTKNHTLKEPLDTHLLVVDDDNRIRELLKRFLSQRGFRVSTAGDAHEARRLLAGLTFDLIVLDVMMPGEDGFALTKSLRQVDDVPIILLTARGDAEDRIKGLSLGADDYLPKPFEPEELVLRIRAILKRQSTKPRAHKVKFGDWVYDLNRQVLTHLGERVHLTTGENALLTTLAHRVGAPVSREGLAEQINAKSERAVDVQITRLRRKLETRPASPEYLLTVRNRGYALQAEPHD